MRRPGQRYYCCKLDAFVIVLYLRPGRLYEVCLADDPLRLPLADLIHPDYLA